MKIHSLKSLAHDAVTAVDQFRTCRRLLQTFESELQKMISKRDDVLKKAEETNKETHTVNDAVLEWLKEAENLLEEVKRMETERKNHNWFSRRYLDVEASNLYEEMKEKIKLLYTRCDEIEPFYIPILAKFFPAGCVCFKSTEEASDKLLEALKDDSCYMIGLHGLKGSGKTTLVNAVAEKAKVLKLFDAVVFVPVSQRPDALRIQEKIAHCFDLKLDRRNEVARAKSICLKLQGEKRILMILDDVQAKLELQGIGIPLISNRCKVLLTTCQQQVCTLMKCDREIPLHPLSEEEAWDLFRTHSGIAEEDCESSSNLLEVARNIAIACEGLPGKIKHVGSSLRGKPIEEWEASLKNLRHPLDQYQVFISFRGKDTRNSFTSFLDEALRREGLNTFIDDRRLEGGDPISPSLIAAIQESSLSIIVLSENYAFSSWCLDELVTILECKKTKNQHVLPIFYKVHPISLRNQENEFGKAMEAHEKKLGTEKVKKWREALFEVACLSGDPYNGTEYECQFIKKIVDKVYEHFYTPNMAMD